MPLRRLPPLTLPLLLLGLGVAGAWVFWSARGAPASALLPTHPAFLLPILLITGGFVFIRFVRWQFLLRRAEVRVPTRGSLSVYLASLLGTATPAYVGELVRGVFLRRRFGSDLRVTISLIVTERILDVMALALIGLVSADRGWLRLAMVVILLGAALLGVVLRRVSIRMGVKESATRWQAEPLRLLQALFLSLLVWIPVGWGLSLAAMALDQGLDLLSGMRVYSSSTLFGGFTLMPAGIATAGSAAIYQLGEIGFDKIPAVATVTLFRAMTTGLCLAGGAAFFVLELKAARRGEKPAAAEHFDGISEEYQEQFQPHVWDLLFKRRLDRMARKLGEAPEGGALLGLDVGCGLGLQARGMNERGYRMIGLDRSLGLLRSAHKGGVSAVGGDALVLPFPDDSFDFAYAVGSLHHLDGAEAQDISCREVARVLKPGGLLIVQETNTRNPLFVFYMGYVFPILSSIDEGTEHWIDPTSWSARSELGVEEVDYFTFLPDFVPRFLMKPLLALERWLEQGRLRSYSVHYQVTLRKPG